MNTKLLGLSPKIRREVERQVTLIKITVNNAIPVDVDKLSIIIALSELIGEFSELIIQDDPQELETADGKLKAVAPELLQVCKELAAWITIAPEFQDWPAAKSRLRELNKIIVKADPTHPVLQEAANVPH